MLAVLLAVGGGRPADASAIQTQVAPEPIVSHDYLDSYAASGFGGYEIGDQTTRVLNVPVTIWLRHTRDHPWGLRLRVTGVLGVQQFDRVGDLRPDDIRAAALIPGVELVFPLSRTSTLRPYLDVGAGWELDGDRAVGYSSAGLWTEFVFPWRAFELGLEPRAAWRASWRDDGPGTGHALVSIRADARHPLWFEIAGHLPEVGPYLEPGYFVNGLEFTTAAGRTIELRQQYEVGVGFSFRGEAPRLWFVRVPYIGLGYRFGGDLQGLRVRIGGDRLTRLPRIDPGP